MNWICLSNPNEYIDSPFLVGFPVGKHTTYSANPCKSRITKGYDYGTFIHTTIVRTLPKRPSRQVVKYRDAAIRHQLIVPAGAVSSGSREVGDHNQKGELWSFCWTDVNYCFFSLGGS